MKNIVLILLLLALIGGGYMYYANSKAQTGGGGFSVALVTPGPQNDGSWNQNAARAVDKIKDELGAEVYKVAAKSTEDAYTSFRKFAGEKKATVVIGHAGEYNSAKTLEIAAANPGTTFLISGSEKSEKNVCGVRFVLEDATYVLGQMAALMSKSGKLGCIGPEQFPVIASTFSAFEQGAKSIKPDATVRVMWTGNSSDLNRAKEQALQMIGDGVDFIFQNANSGAQGVFEAVQQSKDKGVFVFGSNDDQAVTMPRFDDVILASAVIDCPTPYVALCKKIKEGKFESKVYFVGMPEGAITVALNKKLEAKIPADARKKIDETVEKIKKGEKLYKPGELK